MKKVLNAFWDLLVAWGEHRAKQAQHRTYGMY
jgi:hypothetical protein